MKPKTMLALGGLGVAALFALAMRGAGTPDRTVFRWPVMGTVAQLTVRNGDARADILRTAVQETYRQLDDLLSAWNPSSELSRLAAAHCTNWVEAASPRVRSCYAAALKLLLESAGAFNPHLGAKLRELGVAGGGSYSDFDLGAIAKGFAVDCAAAEIRRLCATNPPPSLLLDLGGNLRIVGEGAWRTGVRNPFERHGPLVGVLALTNGESVATSGNYERSVERDGIRYSHILDGRTGEPTHGIAGVTVVTPPDYGATLADGLSTTLFVLGPEDGVRFLARFYPRALALWIPDTPAAPHVRANAAMVRRLEHVVWSLDEIRD